MKDAILVFFLTVSLSATGQTHLIGLKGGVNLTNINSDAVRHTDPRTGFSCGLSYEYFFKEKFSMSTDIIYSQLGFSYTLQFVGANGDPLTDEVRSNFKYNYLSIPIKTGFTIGKTGFGFANIGIVPSILLKEKITNLDAYGNITKTGKVRKFDLAGYVDIGGGYKFERFWLFASIAFLHSFTTMTPSDYYSEVKMKHYGLMLSSGVKYQLRTK